MTKLLLQMFLLLCCFFFSSKSSADQAADISHPTTKCNEADISNLLGFINSFHINCEVSSGDDYAPNYPKTSSWNASLLEAGYVEGVRCDPVTGHVIGLYLSGSCLYGSINSNSTIFNLLHLEQLDLSSNNFSFSTIPRELGNLSQLTDLFLMSSYFTGAIPLEISKLSNLYLLDLSENELVGAIPLEISKLSNLCLLNLNENELVGEIPSSLSNLTYLSYLFMSRNALNCEILAWLANLTLLDTLGLGSTNLRGSIPNSIFFNMTSLGLLDLSDNKLSGPLELDMFFQLENLVMLDLSGNNLIFISNSEPEKFFKRSSSLSTLFIGSNNKLQGRSIPIPPPSLEIYEASNIEFTGELSPSICSLSTLIILNISNSHFTGELPHCFATFSDALQVLDLRNNSFHGKIPELCSNNNNNGSSSRLLKMIDLNGNRFDGQLPRSLANCSHLELLDVGSNLINDTFPSWLGSLPHLRVIVLNSNQLCGSIERRIPDDNNGSTSLLFPKLHIIDLSYNNLSGKLPSSYFQRWDAMKSPPNPSSSSSDFMSVVLETSRSETEESIYSVTINDKGMKLKYAKILGALIIIDLSCNMFRGEIPEILGNLRGLHSLNLSYNRLTGPVPSSLANLRELQSLDLSSNRLSGDIPPQLSQLGFLSIFNVSYNKNLTGPIPKERQFDTFDNSSYVGDSGLCGRPLSRTCGNNNSPTPPHDDDVMQPPHEEKHDLVMVVLIGVVGGLVFGVAMENTIDWRTTIMC